MARRGEESMVHVEGPYFVDTAPADELTLLYVRGDDGFFHLADTDALPDLTDFQGRPVYRYHRWTGRFFPKPSRKPPLHDAAVFERGAYARRLPVESRQSRKIHYPEAG